MCSLTARIVDLPMRDPVIPTTSLMSELRLACEGSKLQLHYQPIRDALDLCLVAFESLIRWPHPIRGMVPPSEFIPQAEQSALIHDLGAWVLRQACRDLPSLGTRFVGVNVSAAQLRRVDFAKRYARIVREEGIEIGQVTIEITETLALHDNETERRNLKALRDLGCWLAIDDCGTGHASADYLDKFPFNALKIDRTFVRELGRSDAAFAAVADLCDLGRRRDVVIIAEGVETPEQLDLLRQAGCPRVQGFLLGRPAPVDSWRNARAVGIATTA